MIRTGFLMVILNLVLLIPVSIAQDCFHWIDKTPLPGGHTSAKIIHDPVRNRLIAFGGLYGANTWEWDGSSWAILSASTPPFGPSQEAVFDSVRGVIVVFGGGSSGNTWEWDGNSWLFKSQSGPGARNSFEMAYDGDRGVVVLHGGRDVNNNQIFLSDTWEWDGTVWSLRTTSGPSRAHHGMAYDSFRQVTVLYGGRDNPNTYIRETWEWDGAAWSNRNAAPGPFVDDQDMVFDDTRGVSIVLYPASINGWFQEWLWDGSTWNSMVTVGGPRPRYETPLAFDSARGVTTLFGGDYWSDLWEWDGNEWKLLWGGLPSTTTLTYDRQANRTVALEGHAGNSRLWQLNEYQWSIENSDGPEIGRDSAIAFDENRNVLVVFGGVDLTPSPDLYFGNTWEWDGTTWTLRATDGPSARSRHRMIYDAARGVVVLFGGWNGANLGDTWEWDGNVWTLKATSGPSPRFWSGLAYDRSRNKTVLAGGANSNGVFTIGLSGTWEWDGQTWTQRSSNQPPARYSPAFAYDESRGVFVLVGGWQLGPTDAPVYVPGTREWDGSAWTLRTSVGTVGGVGVYDVLRSRIQVHLGDETWEYMDESPSLSPPIAEPLVDSSGQIMAQKNRYVSILAPNLIPEGASGIALRVRAHLLPGVGDCPNVPDFSDRFQREMWVGDEVVAGGDGAGLFRLSSTPVFRDWGTVPGGVVHVADCNIVPCASYSVEAVTDVPCNPGVPTVFSEPVIITTSGVWGDIVGGGFDELPNGVVDFVDISACVDRFRNSPIAPPGTWCDLGGNNPTQGVLLAIDFSDISQVVDAFRGLSYPFSGPSAPDPCP